MSAFAPMEPVAVYTLEGDAFTLARQIWPDLREQLIRWHLTGAAQLFRAGELVDPVALRSCDDVLGLEWRVYDPQLAAGADRQYGRQYRNDQER